VTEAAHTTTKVIGKLKEASASRTQLDEPKLVMDLEEARYEALWARWRE
jgi:hypothetical protein